MKIRSFTFAAILVAISISGCASSGITKHFPRNDDLENHATVFVIRSNDSFAGSAVSVRVVLNGFVIGRLMPGKYFRFRIEPGHHHIGIIESSVSINFEKGGSYFFKISPIFSLVQITFGFERIEEDEGRKRVAKYRGVLGE